MSATYYMQYVYLYYVRITHTKGKGDDPVAKKYYYTKWFSRARILLAHRSLTATLRARALIDHYYCCFPFLLYCAYDGGHSGLIKRIIERIFSINFNIINCYKY